MQNRPLDELAGRFLEHLEIEKNVSPLTIRNYQHYLHRFLNFCAKRFSTPGSSEEQDFVLPKAEDLDEEIIRNYRLYLSRFENDRGEKLSRVTQGYHVIALRSFLRFLIRRDVKTLEPDKIDVPKGEDREPQVLTLEQLKRLLEEPKAAKINELRDKAILEMFFSTGLRVAELVRLNREDIDLKRKEFGVMGKGRRVRIVFLSDRAEKWIRRYFEKRDDDYKPLFIRYSGPKSKNGTDEEVCLSARSVQRAVKKYAKRAGLPVNVTPHILRHTFATDLLRSGADIRSVQEMLGHKNIVTTQIYTHVTNPQLKKVHKQYHSGNK